MRTDLHIHTTASDGCWTPAETVAHVRETGIDLFAIADHESTANVVETAALARAAGLAFLPAVEVTTLADNTNFHVLGYGIDPLDPALDAVLSANIARMHWVNDETLRRLAHHGHPVSMEAYACYQNDPSRGGWSALNYLIDLGVCRDAHDFFARIFVPPFRPPEPDFPHPAEAAALIRAAGGLPILAHPGASLRQQGLDKTTLAPFVEFDLAGIECYTSYHDPAATQVCLDFCRHHDLLITGGSDCHGRFVGRPLGIPAIYLADLRLGPLEEYIR